MFSRRSVLLASIAVGMTMQRRNALANASQPSTPVNFDVPAGACDCHTHIHPDPAKFPFFSGRVYTPELASPELTRSLWRQLRRLGLGHQVQQRPLGWPPPLPGRRRAGERPQLACPAIH